VLDVLHSDRFVDTAPREVVATLLDEDQYVCSERTMYRILEQEHEVLERRNQLRHPAYARPELMASRPNSLWSWDITKLLGPRKWTYFYLYVMIDIFSRYVVGWMVAHRESRGLAKRFIAQSFERQGSPAGLTIHADRGPSMRSKEVAFLMADLGITKTHSRPYTSADNPFSESHFKTMKYRPDFPERFGCLQDTRSFCGRFFEWYNRDHRHSGLAMLTPSDVHHGRTQLVLEKRRAVMQEAFERNPERFVAGPPRVRGPEPEVWINKPASSVQLDAVEVPTKEEVLH
jgi:putative transposase